jgi:hypothetical protein
LSVAVIHKADQFGTGLGDEIAVAAELKME